MPLKLIESSNLMAKYCCKVIKMVLKSLFGNTLDKNMKHIAASQLVYIEIQFTDFCVIQAFTKGFFWKDFKTAVVLRISLDHSLGTVNVF